MLPSLNFWLKSLPVPIQHHIFPWQRNVKNFTKLLERGICNCFWKYVVKLNLIHCINSLVPSADNAVQYMCAVIASVIIGYAAKILILGIKLSRIDAIIAMASDPKIFRHYNINASHALSSAHLNRSEHFNSFLFLSQTVIRPQVMNKCTIQSRGLEILLNTWMKSQLAGPLIISADTQPPAPCV